MPKKTERERMLVEEIQKDEGDNSTREGREKIGRDDMLKEICMGRSGGTRDPTVER